MEQAKIVIVDDDQDIRDTLQHILEGRQYKVITAANKEEGLEKIRAEKPDLTMLDVMMETWQDGFEMARILKKDPDLKEKPPGFGAGSGVVIKAEAAARGDAGVEDFPREVELYAPSYYRLPYALYYPGPGRVYQGAPNLNGGCYVGGEHVPYRRVSNLEARLLRARAGEPFRYNSYPAFDHLGVV